MQIRPAIEQAEREFGVQRQSARLQPAAPCGGQRKCDFGILSGGGIELQRRVGVFPERIAGLHQAKLVARQLAAIVEVEHEFRGLAAEHRSGAARAYLQMRQVAERVQHRHHRHHRQQKGQHIAQAQVVVDVAEQHQHQHEDQRETLPGRDDEDAALGERDRAVSRCVRRNAQLRNFCWSDASTASKGKLAWRFVGFIARLRERIEESERACQISFSVADILACSVRGSRLLRSVHAPAHRYSASSIRRPPAGGG